MSRPDALNQPLGGNQMPRFGGLASMMRLPDIVGAGKNLYERTAAATSATVDTVKQGMQSVIDVVW